MTNWQIALRSLKYYLRSNLTIALGVAAATAVLTGALIVGESMRESLKSLTLERLGRIDEMLVSEGFFREQLATEVKQTKTFQAEYDDAIPLIMFPGGTVESKPDAVARRAGQVTVLGINDSFWSFETLKAVQKVKELSGESAIINQTLADDLQISSADVKSGAAKITVRVPKQTQLPADSALGRKTDLIESLVDLTVVEIIPTKGLGRFSLHPSQEDPLNVFVPIKLLQDSLEQTVLKHKADPAQANVLLFSSKSETPPEEAISQQLEREIRPTFDDLGLSLKRVTQSSESGGSAKTVFDYWSVSSDRLVISDEAVESITGSLKADSKMSPAWEPAFTYLANDIRLSEQESGIPFSMVAAIDFGETFEPVSATSNEPIRQPKNNEIVLNEWAANDLEAKVGDKISLAYFEPETTHGSQVEGTAEFTLIDIAKLTEPDLPFVVPRRGPMTPAQFKDEPTVANDPDLTPEVPGVTDAQSIDNWDLPFQTTDQIRPQDDDYWDNYRTTPKAFISLAAGQKLWDSRFGKTTSLRLAADKGSRDSLKTSMLEQFAADEAKLGLHLVSIKRRGLAASSGSTPFDVLFLALSMFVIGSALILVSLLFRLGLQQRAAEVGLLKATGFNQKGIRKLWLSEMSIVCLIGAILGIMLGVGYAALMIKGLTTWWVGAISRPFLTMHVSPLSLLVGLFSGLLICVVTILWSLKRTQKQSIRGLLGGQLESQALPTDAQKKSKLRWLPAALIVTAVGLAVMATQLSGEAQAGSFMGSGFLILIALLMLVYRWLSSAGNNEGENQLSLSRLALMSAKRNPLRSTLTIGLVAVASFLVAAVSAFRLAPTESGTAGFDWVAQSSQPVFGDLSTKEGQLAALGEDYQLSVGTEVVSIRYKSGEDASCNNLYQSTQPRVLGVSEKFVTNFDESEAQFAWGGTVGRDGAAAENPWHLLDDKTVHAGTKEDPIPVVIDKNTANYSLKIYMPGTVREVHYDSGESFHFVAVGFLANTILQGSLIMSETDFESAFPTTAGYQYFLIRDGDLADGNKQSESLSSSVAILEDRLGDQGFDARSADKLLSNFMAVQNTYLSTFQTLGALGLLLGTFGLAAVQVRSVLERTKELGLMRAVGFSGSKLSRMVLMENAWLLFLGMAVGIGAALFTTIPHWLVGTASVPWATLGIMFAGIVIVGLAAAWLASRNISRLPLLDSLRV